MVRIQQGLVLCRSLASLSAGLRPFFSLYSFAHALAVNTAGFSVYLVLTLHVDQFLSLALFLSARPIFESMNVPLSCFSSSLHTVNLLLFLFDHRIALENV